MSAKNNLLAIARTTSICWGPNVSLLRANRPQVTQTRIIHGHSRLYRGRYRSFSIRFRAISHGASRKRWCEEQAASVARRYFWIHDAFFGDTHPSIPEPRQKKIGGKTWPMQKGERIAARTTAVNCDRFCRWLINYWLHLPSLRNTERR